MTIMTDAFMVLIILGIVQGIAEFIPISSSGHLVVLEQIGFFKTALQGMDKGGMLFINVVLHLATLLALVVYFLKDITVLIRGFVGGVVSRDFQRSEVRVVLSIFIASIPAGIVGLIFHDFIEDMFSSAVAALIFLIINGIILIFTKKLPVKDRKLDEIGLIRSFWIGLFQAFAILPGISRSGMTITGGMAMGLAPVESARFSFLMAIPVIIGAGAVEGIKASQAGLPQGLMPALAAGAIISLIAGLVSLKVLFMLVKKFRIYIFGIYTIIVGVIGLIILSVVCPR